MEHLFCPAAGRVVWFKFTDDEIRILSFVLEAAQEAFEAIPCSIAIEQQRALYLAKEMLKALDSEPHG